MRLTLRTLLAYLDNTLDPEAAEVLRSKLSESGFATQLVQRIREALASGTLAAPSPQAVGPVEEANVISEYLDSTLPAEQVAEIERACLESDPHLAEAAACHQILTMVLGQPAQVSPELRKRIYELPDRGIDEIATAKSFSGVAIPMDEPQLKPLSDDLPTADVTAHRDSQPVRPVGVADSGVSDAPTRLREIEEAGGLDVGGDVAIAGARARSAENDAKIYAGSIRPSRIAPWLVSLALAGVLLFALTRIFQPLLNPSSASLATQEDARTSIAADPIVEEIEVAPEDAPVMVEVADGTDDALAVTEPTDDAEVLPSPPAEAALDSPDDLNSDSASVAGGQDAAVDSVASTDTTAGEASPPAPPPAQPPASPAEMAASPAEMAASPAEMAASPAEMAASPAEMAESPAAKDSGDPPVPPPPVDVVEPSKNDIAKITGPTTLLAALAGDQWGRLEKDAMVGQGLKIACAPSFRGEMTLDNAIVTLVGPTQVEWLVGDNDEVTLLVDFGRVLVKATQADTTINVQLGDDKVALRFADIESLAAASLKHFRAQGFDPLVPENRIPLAGILSVQGTIALGVDGKSESLGTGQQWIKRESAAAKISPAEAVPAWIDPPDPTASSLESSARSGLLEMLKGEQPLEIALRESTTFRRSEVGALAARTLATLGRGDVYFGGDGVLSEPKQRAYWPEHFLTLTATVDRGADSAQQMLRAIAKMDSANAEPLFRLLTGYSQKQLEEGGDKELVELLDSSSMAVRVLALENLHRITGTTLYYRAEQENAVRRAPVIKKWEVRLRKGDIRWQE